MNIRGPEIVLRYLLEKSCITLFQYSEQTSNYAEFEMLFSTALHLYYYFTLNHFRILIINAH